MRMAALFSWLIMAFMVYDLEAKGKRRYVQKKSPRKVKVIDNRMDWYKHLAESHSQKDTVQLQQRLDEIEQKNLEGHIEALDRDLLVVFRVMEPFRYLNYSDDLRAKHGELDFTSFVVVPMVYDVLNYQQALNVYVKLEYNTQSGVCSVSVPQCRSVRFDMTFLHEFVRKVPYDQHPIEMVLDDGFVLKQGLINSRFELSVHDKNITGHSVRVGVMEFPLAEDYVELARKYKTEKLEKAPDAQKILEKVQEEHSIPNS